MIVRRVSGGGAEDRLGLEELLQTVAAPLAAVARLLVAAERGLEVGAGAVDGAGFPWPLSGRSRWSRQRFQ